MPSVRLSLSKLLLNIAMKGAATLGEVRRFLQQVFMGRRGDHKGLPFALGVWQGSLQKTPSLRPGHSTDILPCSCGYK